MKVLLPTLLLLLLCSTQVHALKCYTCDGDESCKAETECPSSSMYCRTIVGTESISRTCEDECTEDVNVICCQDDLC
ncbi:lymphocyte antigen 6D [Centroberyx gerrardi]|uniref:lymphocyte antigen 6D n=1 Tax=Centroberyx gerrardi TaxID=166262 RepID=UPI003AAD73D2